MPAGITLIEEIEVGAGGLATIDFDSIPQTFKHLEIVYYAKTEGALAAIKFAFNTDTTDGNYQTERILGAGSGISGATFNNRYCGAANPSAEALPAFGEVTFPYYTNTANEHGSLSRGFYRVSGQNYNDHWFCQWNSTAAITRIRLTVDGGGEFKEGSIFSLYGVTTDAIDQKISDLSAITSLDDADEFVVASGGTSKKIAVADMNFGAVDSWIETHGTPTTAFEFEANDYTGLTAIGTPDVESMDTRFPSRYYVGRASGSIGMNGRYASTPSAPWTAVALVSSDSVRGNHQKAFLAVGASASGPFDVCMCYGANRRAQVEYWNNSASFNSGVATPDIRLPPGGYTFIIQARSSTQVDCYIGSDEAGPALNLSYNRNPGVGVIVFGISDENGNYSAVSFDWVRIWNSAITIG